MFQIGQEYSIDQRGIKTQNSGYKRNRKFKVIF